MHHANIGGQHVPRRGTAHVKGDGSVVLGRASKGEGKIRPAFHLILLTVSSLALL